jgi:hypothetical protein
MTQTARDFAPKAIRAAIGVVVLVVVVMVVLSYWGTYRSAKTDGAESGETTASAEGTASAESTASPEGGEEAPAAEEAEPSQGTVVVLIDGLNFRASASQSGDLIAGLDKDTELVYLGTEDGWHRVRTSDGKTGYVSASTQYTEVRK